MARTLTSDREGADARERILRAALEVFGARGFRAAPLDAVARSAGMSRAGVLHHFENKQALLLALLDARDEELALQESRASTETAGDLMQSMHVTVRTILENRPLVQLAHTLTAEAADAEHPAHDWLVRRSRRLRASMASAFEASFARGELRATADPHMLASLCLAAIEGLEAQWLADPDEVDVATTWELFERVLRDALA